MKATHLCILLCLLSVLVKVKPQGVASIRFLDRDLSNHSYVDFNLVGEAGEGVECRTDLSTCCNSGIHSGNWYFPNGERLTRDADLADIYMARRFKNIQVRRKNSADTAGIYRCVIDTSYTSDGGREIVYVGLYSSGGQ